MALPELRMTFEELCKLICPATVGELLDLAPRLAEAVPELAPAIGFDQRSPHHAYDLYTHIAHVTASMPADPTLRWTALLHDVGKIPTFTQDATGRGHFYGHALASADMADAILLRLGAPDALRQRAVLLIRLHMTKLEPDRDVLRQYIAELGREAISQLLVLQEADMGSKGVGDPRGMAQFPKLWKLLEEIEREQTR